MKSPQAVLEKLIGARFLDPLKFKRLTGKKQLEMMREFSKVYDKLDAATAEKMGRAYFDLGREHLALQEKYLNSISTAVSPVAAVLFIQLQARYETQLEVERMKYSPLAE